jgi:pyruvate formate lyase activating enzyme
LPVKILLRKTSLVDFPGCVSSVFFFPGCVLRCPWCHNRELITGGAGDLVAVEKCLDHLKKRLPVLGGVVLSGGEPCLCGELPEIIYNIKKIKETKESKKPGAGKFPERLPVKLDTNGMFPVMLEELLSHEETRPDYIALDLKLAPARYTELLPCLPKNKKESPADLLCRSADLIRGSGITHEYRTLALPGGFITEKDIEALAPLADNAPWYFRPFRGGNCLDPSWDGMEESAEAAAARARLLACKARELGKKGIDF